MNPPMTDPVQRYVPLSKSAHAQLRWRPFTDWRFASPEALVPLASVELSRVAGSYPVVFARIADHIEAAALLGVAPGENLFVNAAGEWAGDYVPATLRARPFVMGLASNGQLVACIDDASPLLVRGEGEGERIFSDAGELAPQVQKTLEFLRGVYAGLAATWKACEALERHGCMEPLEVPRALEGRVKDMTGLYQASERALAALPPQALAELMSLGALGIAYAQRVSLHRLGLLARLAESRERTSSAPPDLSVLDRDGTISLGPLA